MSELRVYEVRSDFNYKSLYSCRQDPPLFHLDLYNGKEVGEWYPPKVEYPVGPEAEGEDKLPQADFPHAWVMGTHVMTERAHAVMADLIGPYVDFLPIQGDGEMLHAFRVRHVIEALDLEASDIEWFHQLKKDQGKRRYIREIRRHVFHEEMLRSEVIFRIPEKALASDYFVTEKFREHVEAHNLTGLIFQRVYPPISKLKKYGKYLEKRNRKRGV